MRTATITATTGSIVTTEIAARIDTTGRTGVSATTGIARITATTGIQETIETTDIAETTETADFKETVEMIGSEGTIDTTETTGIIRQAGQAARIGTATGIALVEPITTDLPIRLVTQTPVEYSTPTVSARPL